MNNVLNLNVKLKGEYRLVANEGTDREFGTGWMEDGGYMPNMVVDQGLNRLGAGSAPNFTYCSIGTGTAAAAASDTSLGAYVAQKIGITNLSQGNLGSPTYAGRTTHWYQFALGAVVGNMTEIGVGSGASGTVLFSRCRIIDGSGTPTALPLTAVDQLTVYYRVTITPVLTDVTTAVTISAVSYGYTVRLANAAGFMSNAYNYLDSPSSKWGQVTNVYTSPAGATLGAVTATVSGAVFTPSTVTAPTYTNGNFYNDCTFSIAPADGNRAGGIGGMEIGFLGCTFQFVFPTPIPKDNTKTLTLVVRLAWSR